MRFKFLLRGNGRCTRFLAVEKRTLERRVTDRVPIDKVGRRVAAEGGRSDEIALKFKGEKSSAGIARDIAAARRDSATI